MPKEIHTQPDFTPPQMRIGLEEVVLLYELLKSIPNDQLGMPRHNLLKKCEAYLKNYAPEKL